MQVEIKPVVSRASLVSWNAGTMRVACLTLLPRRPASTRSVVNAKSMNLSAVVFSNARKSWTACKAQEVQPLTATSKSGRHGHFRWAGLPLIGLSHDEHALAAVNAQPYRFGGMLEYALLSASPRAHVFDVADRTSPLLMQPYRSKASSGNSVSPDRERGRGGPGCRSGQLTIEPFAVEKSSSTRGLEGETPRGCVIVSQGQR